DAVNLAVARDGARLTGRLGDIRIQAGDTLLLEARPGFAEQQRLSRDFLLVSELNNAKLPRYERAWVAAGILSVMVAAAASGVASMLEAALAAAAAMILLRCTSAAAARRSIDWSLLVVIGAALGLGAAMDSSGLAATFATHWLGLAGGSAWLALLLVYALTSLLTEVITNNAAAVLVFPFAEAIAESLGVSLWPFIVAIMMAASASFATPIGYQTNLMVYGPGGYRFSDYLRIGVPLNLLTGAVVVALVPFIWPF
ncbi:MAG: SLC13 family permease, partial [Gammaproteobacteria bacterium]|nr:SLC13 family permease [Gammaproteobacteria bacterium]